MYDYAQKKGAKFLPAPKELDLPYSAPENQAESGLYESGPYSGKPLFVSTALAGRVKDGFGIEAGELRLRESPEVSGMGAYATAQGDAVRLAPGMFRPDTRAGLELLGHELSHVREQASGHVRAPGGSVFRDAGSEARSDAAGAAFASGTLRAAARVYLASAGNMPAQKQEAAAAETRQKTKKEFPTPAEIVKYLKPEWEVVVKNASKDPVHIIKTAAGTDIDKLGDDFDVGEYIKYGSNVYLAMEAGHGALDMTREENKQELNIHGFLSAERLDDVLQSGFDATVAKLPDRANFPAGYEDALKARFRDGSLEAKIIFLKSVTGGSVATGVLNPAKTMHYVPWTQRVRMNYQEDVGLEGAGVGFFHEIGHKIDYTKGPRPNRAKTNAENDREFRALLKKEFDAQLEVWAGELQREMGKKGAGPRFPTKASQILNPANWTANYNAYDELFQRVGDSMRSPVLSPVTDIFSGLSVVYDVRVPGGGRQDMQISGGYSHDPRYWKGISVWIEAAANFYEAQFDPLRKSTLEIYFPKTMKHYEKMLGNIIKHSMALKRP